MYQISTRFGIQCLPVKRTRCIVDPISRHCNDVFPVLQLFDDSQFHLRSHSGKDNLLVSGERLLPLRFVLYAARFSSACPGPAIKAAYHAHQIRSREHQALAVGKIIHVKSLDLVNIKVPTEVAQPMASARIGNDGALPGNGDGS